MLSHVSSGINGAVHHSFEMLFPCHVEDLEIVQAKGRDFERGNYEMLASITVSGEINAVFSFHVKRDLAIEITKCLLGLETIESEDDVYDTVGEATNIIIGTAKNILQNYNINFDISCPRIIRADSPVTIEPDPQSDILIQNFKINDHQIRTTLLFEPEQKEAEQVQPAKKGGTLIVDDDQMTLLLGKQIFKGSDQPIFVAKDGEEAVSIFKENQNDIGLVLMDVQMPKMGGIEASEHIRQLNPNAKILFMSAYHEKGALDDIAQDANTNFIQKPLIKKVVLEKMNELKL